MQWKECDNDTCPDFWVIVSTDIVITFPPSLILLSAQETLRIVGTMRQDFSSGRLLRTGGDASYPSIFCFYHLCFRLHSSMSCFLQLCFSLHSSISCFYQLCFSPHSLISSFYHLCFCFHSSFLFLSFVFV